MKVAVIGAGHWGPNLVRNFDFLPVIFVVVFLFFIVFIIEVVFIVVVEVVFVVIEVIFLVVEFVFFLVVVVGVLVVLVVELVVELLVVVAIILVVFVRTLVGDRFVDAPFRRCGDQFFVLRPKRHFELHLRFLLWLAVRDAGIRLDCLGLGLVRRFGSIRIFVPRVNREPHCFYARQLVNAGKPEHLQKLPCGGIEVGPAQILAATADANQLLLHQLTENLSAIHPANRFDIGTKHGLTVGDHGQCFHGRCG